MNCKGILKTFFYKRNSFNSLYVARITKPFLFSTVKPDNFLRMKRNLGKIDTKLVQNFD